MIVEIAKGRGQPRCTGKPLPRERRARGREYRHPGEDLLYERDPRHEALLYRRGRKRTGGISAPGNPNGKQVEAGRDRGLLRNSCRKKREAHAGRRVSVPLKPDGAFICDIYACLFTRFLLDTFVTGDFYIHTQNMRASD